MNIKFMRAFVRLSRILASHADLARKLADLEEKYDGQFRVVFDAILQLMAPPEPNRRKIGFHVKEGNAFTRRPERSGEVEDPAVLTEGKKQGGVKKRKAKA